MIEGLGSGQASENSRLFIVGAGGFGREVLDIVRALEADRDVPWREFAGFIDDGQVDHKLLGLLDVQLLGGSTSLVALGRAARYAIGIGLGSIRSRLDAMYAEAGCAPTTLLHPAATVGSANRVGEGCIFAAGARVTTNVTLGRHVNIHVNATIGHDSVLDDFASVYPGATVSGNVHLGKEVVIGTGANILPGVVIGDGAYVGAGAVVTRDVEARSTVAGSPARPLPR